ncbi:MAG: helix-turn-helix transcriptional regulator [Thermodesulfobacteriota bacterium]
MADIHKAALDSLATHVAFLDGAGVIVETNRAWQRFATDNGLPGVADCVGLDYLTVCDRASREGCVEAAQVATGIRSILAGGRREFFTQYPCHSQARQRWFTVRVVPFSSSAVPRLIVSHDDITPIMAAQEELRRKESELALQTRELQEANTALRVVLRHQEEERLQVEKDIAANVRRLILPGIAALRQGNRTRRELALIAVAEARLNDLASPFLNRLHNLNSFLTPQEMKVAALIREGRSSKEIAEILAISASGVEFHRKSLRRKFGLTGSGSNLRTHLLSLR